MQHTRLFPATFRERCSANRPRLSHLSHLQKREIKRKPNCYRDFSNRNSRPTTTPDQAQRRPHHRLMTKREAPPHWMAVPRQWVYGQPYHGHWPNIYSFWMHCELVKEELIEVHPSSRDCIGVPRSDTRLLPYAQLSKTVFESTIPDCKIASAIILQCRALKSRDQKIHSSDFRTSNTRQDPQSEIWSEEKYQHIPIEKYPTLLTTPKEMPGSGSPSTPMLDRCHCKDTEKGSLPTKTHTPMPRMVLLLFCNHENCSKPSTQFDTLGSPNTHSLSHSLPFLSLEFSWQHSLSSFFFDEIVLKIN